MRCAIAVDVGATNLRLATFTGKELKDRVSFKLQGSVSPLNYIVGYLEKFSKSCKYIGIASAGPMNLKKGTVTLINYNNLTINYLDSLKGYGKVYITNDCIAGILAEKKVWRSKMGRKRSLPYVQQRHRGWRYGGRPHIDR